MGWISDHFSLIRFDDEAPTIEAILEKARAAVMRHGVRGLVIDPYNEIEHRRPSNMTAAATRPCLPGPISALGNMSWSSPPATTCAGKASACRSRLSSTSCRSVSAWPRNVTIMCRS